MKTYLVIFSLLLFFVSAYSQENNFELEKIDGYGAKSGNNEINPEGVKLEPLSLKDKKEINQPVRTFIVFVGAGISIPVIENDFADDFSVGLNVHGGAGYRLSNNQTLRFGIQYNSFSGPSNTDLTITSLRGDLLFGNLVGGATNVYGYAGIGVYFLNIAGLSETNFGFAGGVGLTFRISDSGTTLGYVEAGLDYNANDGTAKGFIPFKAGVLIIP